MSNQPTLIGTRDLATLLQTTSNQIHMWHQRRATTGFPEAIASTHKPAHPGDKRKAPLFDLDQVLTWRETYDPNNRRGSHWADKREAIAS